jgi:uncharacterized protein YfiM (DUF2279 family)
MRNPPVEIPRSPRFEATLKRRRLLFLTVFLTSVASVSSSAGAQAHHTRQHDSWLGADKIKHFFLSAFIESITFSGLQAAGVHRDAAFAGAIGATATFGIGREVRDKRTKGLFSLADLTWDALGAGTAALMLRSTQH